MKQALLIIALALTLGVSAQTKQTKQTTAKVVYVSPNGKKYHTRKDCQYIRNSSNVKQMTEEEAKKADKSVCSRCQSATNKAKEKKQ